MFGLLNEDYGWELSGFRQIRSYDDGIDFINLIINWDRYLADHSPKFEIHFVLMNWTIIEFNVYYLHHRE